MKFRFLLLSLCLGMMSTGLFAQTISWTGLGDGTSWNDPNNWNPANIPTATDDVEIPDSGDNVIIPTGFTAVAQYLNLKSPYGFLTIESGAVLDITGNATNRGLQLVGTATNNGTIYISNCTEGLYIGRPFTNTGSIYIESTSSRGIRAEFHSFSNTGLIQLDDIGTYGISLSSLTFNNEGTINIGTTGGANNISRDGIQNINGTFNNLPGGTINIGNTTYSGIANGNIFINEGDLNIYEGIISQNGITNTGTFTNESTGTILIDNTLLGGIIAGGSDYFINKGSIEMGATSIGTDGIFINGLSYLDNTGSISIDNTGANGIYMLGNLINKSTISIGATQISGYGIRMGNYAILDIQTGATITVQNTTNNFLSTTFNSTIMGTGTLNSYSNLPGIIGAHVKPGASPGILTLNSNLNLESTSNLEIEITGTTPGTEHDQLVINGDVMLNSGGLTIINSAALVDTDIIEIIYFSGDLTGTFDPAKITGLPPGWQVGYNKALYSDKVILYGPGAVVPVELLEFEATARDKKVELNWSTASETNNKGFEIQRSADGEEWEILDFVEGQGTTSEQTNYVYTDINPFDGKNYYRLKQVDFDGKNEFSPIRMIEIEKGKDITVFPNPASDFIYINTDFNTSDLQVEIIDINGKIVYSNLHAATDAIPTEHLTNGLYTIKLKSKNASRVSRFVKLMK